MLTRRSASETRRRFAIQNRLPKIPPPTDFRAGEDEKQASRLLRAVGRTPEGEESEPVGGEWCLVGPDGEVMEECPA